MKIFVVNLKEATDRRAFMERQLNELQLEFEIIDAVNGKQLSHEERERSINKDFEQLLMPGEIGCSLSHLKIYRKIIEENLQGALVLEDDTVLNNNLKEVLEAIKFSDKPEVILLSSPCRIIKNNEQKITSQYTKFKTVSALGTYGYIINRAAAQNILNKAFPVWLHADDWMKFIDLRLIKLYSILPTICTLSDYNDTTYVGVQSQRDILFKQHKKQFKNYIPFRFKVLKGIKQLYRAVFCKQIKIS